MLKGSLDSILSPSVKIQIIGGKVCLRCKGKILLGVVNKLLKTTPSNVLLLYIKQTCLNHKLNFHFRWRWCDGNLSIFLNHFYCKSTNSQIIFKMSPILNYLKYFTNESQIFPSTCAIFSWTDIFRVGKFGLWVSIFFTGYLLALHARKMVHEKRYFLDKIWL